MLVNENDERIKIVDGFIQGFTKKVSYKLDESQTSKVVDKYGNVKIKTPKSIGLDPFYTYFDHKKKSLVTLRFAENAQPKKIGGIHQIDYYPTNIEFRGMSIICDPTVAKDIELHYFLFNHPRRKGSPNFDDKKGALFILEDLAANAKNEMSKRKLRNDLESKILDQWSDTELQEMSLSFGDLNAIGKTADEHRKFLLAISDKDPVNFQKRSSSEEMPLRAKIVDGEKKGILIYNETERMWYWGSGTGRDASEIVMVRSGEDPKTRLIQYWNKALKEENLDYFLEKLKIAYETV